MRDVLEKASQTNTAQKQVQIVPLDSRHSSAVQWGNTREKEMRMIFKIYMDLKTIFKIYVDFPVLFVNVTLPTVKK